MVVVASQFLKLQTNAIDAFTVPIAKVLKELTSQATI